jgi:hypothetical protein
MTEDSKKRLGKVVQIDERRIQDHLGELVRGTVEGTLNGMLDAEADALCGAQRFVGAVIGTMHWGRPTGILCHIRSTWDSGWMSGRRRSPTGPGSAPNWTTKPSVRFAWRSTRTSPSEIHASARRSKP